MNNSSHTHRLSLSWWLGYISIGGFLLFIVINTVIFNASAIFASTNILDYSGIFLLIAIMLPLSLVLLVRPFLIKIIVKPQGIEYHSTFFILQTNWENLVNIGYVQKTNAGKTLVIIPKEGKLTYRKWVKPFRNLLKEYPNEVQDVQILVSQFHSHNGHSFESDILANVAQQTETF